MQKPSTPRKNNLAKSSFETPHLAISDATWLRGVSAFFSEDVPFSFSTGAQLSGAISNLIQDLFQKKAIIGLELGAGLGFLSRNIVDRVHLQNPTNNNFEWHLSESAPSLVDSWTDSFPNISGTDRFHLIDFLKANLPPKLCPNFLTCSYLLDSLPCISLSYRNGKLYEILTQTTVKADARLIDTSVFPPKILDHHDLEYFISTPKPHKLAVLGPKLLPFLEETHIETPLDMTKLNPKDQEVLNAYLLALMQQNLGDIKFNYVLGLPQALDTYFLAAKKSHQNWGFLVHDFGFSTPDSITTSSLWSNYGTTRFMAVNFDFISWYAQQSDLDFHLEGGCSGGDQFLLISSGSFDKSPSKLMTQNFKGLGTDAIKSCIKNCTKSNALSDTLKKELCRLSQDESKSYFLNISLAKYFLRTSIP